MNRWHRYWFDDGGRSALAVIRIAVAICVLMTLLDVSALPQLVARRAVYRPVGIWMLLGATPPPEALVTVLWAIAGGSTAAMLLGVWSRAATATSFVSAVALTSLAYSGSATWSHSYNVVFLAHLALLGGRCGDALSIDARLRGPINLARGYQWSVRLVQAAVALMFITACYHKLRAGGFTLAWATSDNLRHQLLARYDLVQLPRPAIVDWLLAESWRYRTAACLNLVSQAAPLLAIVFVRRPKVRAVVAVLFLVEGIAIDQLMGLPNPQWLPLAAVFVDWDHVIARFRAPPAPTGTYTPPRRVHVFIVAFLVYDVVVSIVPKLDHRLGTYPFSAFQMFAVVRASPPWDEHRPYSMYGDSYAIDGALDPAVQRYYDHAYRFMYMQTDPARLEPRLATILSHIQTNHPAARATRLRHHLAMFVVPAYPGPARFDKRLVAVTAELAPDGLHTVLGAATATSVELRPRGVDASTAQLVYYAAHESTPIALAATRTGNTFTLAQPLPARAEHVVAIIGDTRWLVWSRRTRK
ncbi:MAG TPA: hypothetical protein VK427_11545 [Kofleriaceae bacterium]|nr:hypothetical protein [Kofleriaceae bacterium]